MALEDFVLPTEEVALPGGGSFAVRGLSLEDITLLLAKHGPVMEDFFQRYSGNSEAGAMEVGMKLLNQAPALVAQTIALAADSPEKEAVVRKLPLAVQKDALEKLSRLTFDASGGPGKFFEAVISLIKSTTNAMSGLTLSQNGSSASGVK